MIVVFDEEVDLEDLSKQGRKIEEIDQDPGISLIQHDADIQGRYEQDMEFVFDDAKEVSTAEKVSIVGAAVTAASVDISPASPTRRVSIADDIIMAETLVYIRRSATKRKDKGYSISKDPEEELIEEEPLEEPNDEGKEDGGMYFIWVSLIGDVRTLIMDEAHVLRYLEHPGADKTYHNLRDIEILYHLRKENVVDDALSRKERVKPRRVRAMSMTISQVLRTRYWLLQVRRPRLPRSSNGYDTNWVIVDRLTKSAYFLAIREYYKMEKLARFYIDEIVAGHGVPVSIISDHDGRFTSRLLKNIIESLRDAIGYEYSLSSLDGRTKSPILWCEIRESRLIGPELVQETTDKVVLIKEKLKVARERQKSYADNRRKLLEFEVEDQVLLKVSPWKAYRLRLPEKLSSVHDTFHVSNLKKFLADANLHVPLDEIKIDKTLRFIEEPVEIIDHEVEFEI
nr:hypothetical protein [Tanacetum cinerariifolium]